MTLKRDSTFGSTSSVLQQLVQRLAQGDAKAIEAIYRDYFHRLLYYGNQVAGPGYEHEVEDVIQEFFIWLAENRAKVEQVRNFESYMFQSIRRNLQCKLSAGKKSHAAYERYVSRTSPLREYASCSPEQLQIQHEEMESIKALIQRGLDQLPPYLREVLYLRYFEDKSYPEIAAILSVSDQVAYNYVYRAVKRLKKRLGDPKVLWFSLYGIVTIFLSG
jgi:RNA polymerase sigma factor (sigma-70 family)